MKTRIPLEYLLGLATLMAIIAIGWSPNASAAASSHGLGVPTTSVGPGVSGNRSEGDRDCEGDQGECDDDRKHDCDSEGERDRRHGSEDGDRGARDDNGRGDDKGHHTDHASICKCPTRGDDDFQNGDDDDSQKWFGKGQEWMHREGRVGDRDGDRHGRGDDDDEDRSTMCQQPPTPPTPVVLRSCLPASSLSVLIQGTNVSSYVPNGAWMRANTDVQLVPVEGTGVSRATIPTPSAVNSCASNSATGETVCTSNGTDVYLITGSTLRQTVSSGGTGTVGFSGGSCTTCGVAIDAAANTAVVTVADGAAGAFQTLDLATGTFAPVVSSPAGISEDIQIDPFRNLILSPTEGNPPSSPATYVLVQTTPTAAVFDNVISGLNSQFERPDSAAEDCVTGIALASVEDTNEVFLADLTQAAFTPGSPTGTWTAPSQLQSLTDFTLLSEGVNGIAVAPSSHLGVVAGEFGGTQFAVIQLPATSGSGTPSLVDWAASDMPHTPDGVAWALGEDPHALTAYVSPNSSKAFGLLTNSPPPVGTPTFLAQVDLQALLKAPRTPGTHRVDPTFDLVANNVVVFIKVRP